MKITIDEIKNGEIIINEFIDEQERKWFIEFMRVFSLLRLQREKGE